MDYVHLHQGQTYVYRTRDGGNGLKVPFLPSNYDVLEAHFGQPGLEVCSVDTSESKKLVDPGGFLEYLASRKVPLTSPYGDWHAPLEPELKALELAKINQVAVAGDEVEASRLFSTAMVHPAVRSGLGYALGNVLSVPLTFLLGTIFDIRRFIQMDGNLESVEVLQSYFRLDTPQGMCDLVGNKATQSSRRSAFVYMAWNGVPLCTITSEQAESAPEFWLHRYYYAESRKLMDANPPHKATMLAAWKTSQRFLELIQGLWLHGIGLKEFHPEKFFPLEKDVEGFLGYIKKSDNSLDNLSFDFKL